MDSSSAAAAAAAPADADPACYICYEPHSEDSPLLTVPVCKCRGSIRLHLECFLEVSRRSANCSVCKARYRHPSLIDFSYDPDDPELAGARYRDKTRFANIYGGKLHEFYFVDDNNTYHGLSKTYYCPHPQYTSNSSNEEWTLYETCTYHHGKYHGTYKRWSRDTLNGQPVHQELELTYDNGFLRGPFKVFNSHHAGRLMFTGTISCSRSHDPRETTYLTANSKFIGELKEWHFEEGALPCPVIDCVFKAPTDYPAFSSDWIADNVANLADGCWKLPFRPSHKSGAIMQPAGVFTVNIANGRLHGAIEARLFDGTLAEKAYYHEGELHGEFERYQVAYLRRTEGYRYDWKVVGLLEKGEYHYGQRHGEFTMNVPIDGTDTVIATRPYMTCRYELGNKVGKRTIYDRTGEVQEWTMLAPDGSELLGGRAEFYEQGIIVQKCTYKKGELSGVLELYKTGVRWMRICVCVVGSGSSSKWQVEPGSTLLIYSYTGKLDRIIEVPAAGMQFADLPDIGIYSIRHPSITCEPAFLCLRSCNGGAIRRPAAAPASTSLTDDESSYNSD